jgi:hypothetical protein
MIGLCCGQPWHVSLGTMYVSNCIFFTKKAKSNVIGHLL